MRKNGMSLKDLLEIKTGELLARSEDLKEINESLRLSNQAIRIKAEEIKNSRVSNRIRRKTCYCC